MLKLKYDFHKKVAAALWHDYEMVGIDNIKNGSLITTDLRHTRINKTTFAISGTVNFLSDFSNDWEVIYQNNYQGKFSGK